jgi:hypothetical protein
MQQLVEIAMLLLRLLLLCFAAAGFFLWGVVVVS